MVRIIFGIVFFVTILANSIAYGQSMPPPAHSNSPYYVPPGAQSGNGVNSYPQKRWTDLWGAVVVDFDNRIVGYSADASSQRNATKIAMEECKRKGGEKCRLSKAYHNQCVAMVGGDVGYVTTNAASKEEAAETGMGICKSKNDTNCRVVYSGCSFQERVQ